MSLARRQGRRFGLPALALAPLIACNSGAIDGAARTPRADASGSAQPSAIVSATPSTTASASGGEFVTPLADKPIDKGDKPIDKGEKAAPAMERGDHAFAARLYSTQQGEKGNLVISPSSGRVALSMAWLGAKGKTFEQMRDVLGFDGDTDKVAADMAKSIARWNGTSDPKVKVRVANATWGDQTVPFTATWLDAMKTSYAAPLAKVDFIRSFEPARKTINDWIAVKTEQKIQGTLKEGDLTKDTRFVLVNATYFDGQWSHAFQAKETREGAFHVEAGRDVKKPLMHQTAHFKYGETADAQVLSMPYGAGGYSMVAVLPKDTFGLAKLEKGMTGATIDAWLSAPSWEQEVVVTFPKLRAESRMSLGGALVKLGMKDAFDDRAADFSGIAPHKGPDDNLYLAKVIQKCFVEVDERGTVAAAATVVIGAVPTAVAPMPRVFDATHPFLWFLRDEAGNVLFMGRVVEP
jgi:serpin B